MFLARLTIGARMLVFCFQKAISEVIGKMKTYQIKIFFVKKNTKRARMESKNPSEIFP